MIKGLPFDIAREMVRLADTRKFGGAVVTELLRMFPTATRDDYRRAKIIGLDRNEMLEEERLERARSFAEKWYSGAPKEVIDTAAQLYLRGMKLKPNAETLFGGDKRSPLRAAERAVPR
jgi:hypothetical protein